MRFGRVSRVDNAAPPRSSLSTITGMNVAAQPITRGCGREGLRLPRIALPCILAWLALAAPRAAAQLDPRDAPHVAFEVASGREIYLPTGEPVDLVVPVRATRMPPEPSPSAGRWPLALFALPGLLLGAWQVARLHGRQTAGARRTRDTSLSVPPQVRKA